MGTMDAGDELRRAVGGVADFRISGADAVAGRTSRTDWLPRKAGVVALEQRPQHGVQRPGDARPPGLFEPGGRHPPHHVPSAGDELVA